MDSGVKRKIEFEITQLDQLLSDAEPLLALCKIKVPDFVELSAAALCLHSFYNGVENILLLIVKQIDAEIPIGDKWHKKLLDRAFEQTNLRTAVFREDFKEKISEYLNFRHFVRHAYSFKLKWTEIEDLVVNMEEIWAVLKEELNLFMKNN
ncbi:hypothetical protein NO2_0248 [Candidatus Termititenax persephonae]|uniref:HepT-like domain-containing protein n=1 Tax=Candidatus Termititenax persephonae TaxID=2218525 RepID=A0A388TEX0_9BACT|nr:hypothetical protein NO2_0248 [Candidatus Termititenax persephonae]